jgi:hypothetical protein
MQSKRALVWISMVLLLAVLVFVVLSNQDSDRSDGTRSSDRRTTDDAADTNDPERVDRRRIVNRTPSGEGAASGLVLESGTERPLPGVTVRLVAGRPGPDTTVETITAKDGTFAFASVVGFPTWELVVVPSSPLAALHVFDVAIEAGKPNPLGTFYVLPSFEVPGVVVDELGAPI